MDFLKLFFYKIRYKKRANKASHGKINCLSKVYTAQLNDALNWSCEAASYQTLYFQCFKQSATIKWKKKSMTQLEPEEQFISYLLIDSKQMSSARGPVSG